MSLHPILFVVTNPSGALGDVDLVSLLQLCHLLARQLNDLAIASVDHLVTILRLVGLST